MSKIAVPFKGRAATDLMNYVKSVLSVTPFNFVASLGEITDYLSELDADCSLSVEISTSDENPTGLTPVAMVQKMDILLQHVLIYLDNCVITDEFYNSAWSVFEHSVLKLHRPHYIQFVTFCFASSSKERADSYLSYLLNIVHDESGDPIGRREAISYVGSFVCRAKLLSWSHSARTGKYLMNFIATLNVSLDRLLLVLTLQTLCYMFAWESTRWDPDSMELDWVCRSKNGLVALLTAHVKSDGFNLLRAIAPELLPQLLLVGRFSSRLKTYVVEAIRDRNELVHPGWKPFIQTTFNDFPFDTCLNNLARAGPLILPLRRDRDATEKFYEDAIMADHPEEEPVEMAAYPAQDDEEVWCYRVSSPPFSPAMFPPHENIVLSRILSSKSFVLNSHSDL